MIIQGAIENFAKKAFFDWKGYIFQTNETVRVKLGWNVYYSNTNKLFNVRAAGFKDTFNSGAETGAGSLDVISGHIAPHSLDFGL